MSDDEQINLDTVSDDDDNFPMPTEAQLAAAASDSTYLQQQADWQLLATDEASQEEFVEQLQEKVVQRPISADDIDYLLSRHPYLTIIDPHQAGYTGRTERVTGRLNSGWLIHDEGSYIALTPGTLRYGVHQADLEQSAADEGEGGIGTLEGQAMQSVWELIDIVRFRWDAVQIIDGNHLTQRNFWIVAKALGVPLSGYAANETDDLIYRHLDEKGVLSHNLSKRANKQPSLNK